MPFDAACDPCSAKILLLLNSLCRKFLSWLESDRFTGRDRHLFAGSGIAADAALACFYDKNAKTTKFYPAARGERVLHRFKERIDDLLGLLFRHTCTVRDQVDDIEFYHLSSLKGKRG